MKTNEQNTLTEKAVAAMKSSMQGVVEEHRRRNRPLAVWKDGKVVYRDANTGQTVREPKAPYGARH